MFKRLAIFTSFALLMMFAAATVQAKAQPLLLMAMWLKAKLQKM